MIKRKKNLNKFRPTFNPSQYSEFDTNTKKQLVEEYGIFHVNVQSSLPSTFL